MRLVAEGRSLGLFTLFYISSMAHTQTLTTTKLYEHNNNLRTHLRVEVYADGGGG
jgi:hypothetical protein